MQPLSALFVKTLLYTPIDKCKVAQIDTQLCFKFEFCSFLAKITLISNFNMFFAWFLCMDVPMLVFAAWLVQELMRVSSQPSLRTKTVSSPNLSPNFHCFHNEWGLSLRISNVRRPFQMIFQIHIIFNNKHKHCHILIKRLVF